MFKSRSKLNKLIKAALIILIALVLYRQVFNKSDIQEIWQLFINQLDQANMSALVFCFLLMPINWFIESIKWRLLVKVFYPISVSKSIKGILSGLSFAVVTPQRVGEYGGRILMLPPQYNWEGVASTFLCSIAQNVVNVLLGLIGTYVFLDSFLLDVSQKQLIVIAIFGLLFLIALYALLQNMKLIVWVLKKIRLHDRVKKLRDKLRFINEIPRTVNFKVLGLSFLRYVVYVLQYLLVLKFFGIEVSWISGISGVSMIYLIQTGIPLPPIMGIAARGEIALIVWGHFTENTLGILSATYGLWIINLIIPSLFGLFYVLKTNILGSIGYEKGNS